jgi:tryptophanyl-tRNA synthetase
MSMKRVVSGIQPSGNPHIGNYFGAMQRWAADQDGQENFFFVANLHALTSRTAPAELKTLTYEAVAWLLAVGVDPERSTIYVQSQVHEHAELTWILNNYATMGELSRMTQYKDKSQKQGVEGQYVGLFDYPVLMASDVLLYQAAEVPVGDDQKQHVELMRDVAERFNNLYGEAFKVPEPTVRGEGARIMSLQDPTKKMSKSDNDDGGCVYLMDDDETIRSKLKRAVTDSGSVVEASNDKPAITNLLTIFSLATGRSIEAIEAEYAGKGYGEFKADLAEALIELFGPIRKAFREHYSDRAVIDEVLAAGRLAAEVVAEATLEDVKAKLGLI